MSWEHWLALGALGVFAAAGALTAWLGRLSAGDAARPPGDAPALPRRRRRDRPLAGAPPPDAADLRTPAGVPPPSGAAGEPGAPPDFGRRADLPPWLAWRLARHRADLGARASGRPGRWRAVPWAVVAVALALGLYIAWWG